MSAPSFRTLLKPTLLLIAFLGLLGLSPISQDDAPIPDISKRINHFTLDLLKQRAQTTSTSDNLILSAQSIFEGMAMNYLASRGETRKELSYVLHFPEDNKALITQLSNLRHQITAQRKDNKIDVRLASSTWIDGTITAFRNDYLDLVQSAFPNSLHASEFKDPKRTAVQINAWVSEQTHDKITQCVQPSDFDSQSSPFLVDEPSLASINAAYFKANWQSAFNKTETRELAFHVNATISSRTPMMHQRSTLLYAENEQLKFLEIPYADGSFSMYVILPKVLLPIRDFSNLVTIDTVINLKRNALLHETDVCLPKFQIKSHLNAKADLSEMGLKSAFDKQTADFGDMLVKKPEVNRFYISKLYHDACIEVSEEGTEAAAATTAVSYSVGCSAPRRTEPVDFNADHPFLFLVLHNQSRCVLFAGWIANPQATTSR